MEVNIQLKYLSEENTKKIQMCLLLNVGSFYLSL